MIGAEIEGRELERRDGRKDEVNSNKKYMSGHKQRLKPSKVRFNCPPSKLIITKQRFVYCQTFTKF